MGRKEWARVLKGPKAREAWLCLASESQMQSLDPTD